MTKHPTSPASDLTTRERMLLFCGGSGTDWQRAGITGETVTAMIVKGLIVRDAHGRPVLTELGRAALRMMLPDL